MTAFSETVSSLSSQQIRRVHENDSLAATRDLLLPKLMSGEIRVRDAEKVAEAAQ
jgi:type I restriction enzyme S subunit